MRLIKLASNLYKLDLNRPISYDNNKASIIWFSYETPIAFVRNTTDVVMTKNIWSSTTGKHLNMVNQYADRLENNVFNALLEDSI